MPTWLWLVGGGIVAWWILSPTAQAQPQPWGPSGGGGPPGQPPAPGPSGGNPYLQSGDQSTVLGQGGSGSSLGSSSQGGGAQVFDPNAPGFPGPVGPVSYPNLPGLGPPPPPLGGSGW